METNILKIAEDTVKDYGSYTLLNRAIPDLRDGLKPVHRRILWAMYKLKFNSNGNYKKSGRTTGEVTGKYHPHGDQSVYKAMVNMVNSNVPLLEGQGNWGGFDAEAAALRYTECRLSKYSEIYLLDKEYLECVPMVPNYDGEFIEPLYLPSKIPNILVNDSEGVAVGTKNLIPSFSLKSIVDLIEFALHNEVTPTDCKKFLKFEYKYGGLLKSNPIDLYSKGKTTLQFSPEYIKDEVNKRITIKSYSPRFNLNSLHKLSCITSIDNLTANKKVNIHLNIKKNTNGRDLNKTFDLISNKLIFSLPCDISYTVRKKENTIFKSSSVSNLINDWVKWRLSFEKKVVKNLIRKENIKLRREKLLLLAVNNKKIILKSLEKNDPKVFLQSTLKIKEEQADFILTRQIKSLHNLEKNKLKDNINIFKKDIKELKNSNIHSRVLYEVKRYT